MLMVVTEFQVYKELLYFLFQMIRTHSLVIKWNHLGELTFKRDAL
jgi:hypothetical protein